MEIGLDPCDAQAIQGGLLFVRSGISGEAKVMSDPLNPGAVLAQYLGGMNLADAAAKIGIGQEHLSNLLTGVAGIDASLATKLARAFGTSAELWLDLQAAFEAWPPLAPARDKSVQDLKDMFKASPAIEVSISQMRQGPPVDDMVDWDRIAPVGREFGSPDYERLAELDNLACEALGSLPKARRWLDTPHDKLDGLAPEEVAETPEGFARVKALLSKPQ